MPGPVPVMGYASQGQAALALRMEWLRWREVADRLAAERGCQVDEGVARSCAMAAARALSGQQRHILTTFLRPGAVDELTRHGHPAVVARLVLEAMAARPDLLAQAVKLARRGSRACVQEGA